MFVVLAIAMGSAVPGMVLHALLDLISGEASYAIFAEDLASPAAAESTGNAKSGAKCAALEHEVVPRTITPCGRCSPVDPSDPG